MEYSTSSYVLCSSPLAGKATKSGASPRICCVNGTRFKPASSCMGAGRRGCFSFVLEQVGSATSVLYGSRPTVYSAPRLSSVAAYGRLLPLDAAALSTPPTCSREAVGDPPPCPNSPCTQFWRLVWTAKRHKGGGRRPGDSRVAVHTKCQSEHRTGVGSQRPQNSQATSKDQPHQQAAS
jgi:hypothetical protein